MIEKIKLSDVVERAIKNSMTKLHTMTIAKITAVNEKTINCQTVISKIVNNEKVDMPEFIEVPVVFMKGGNSYTAHPVAVGDYCLVLFSERCFDAWYSGSDNVAPPELRMHDYSDGFALVGVDPFSKAITIPDIITQIGDTYFEGSHEHVGGLLHTGNVTQEGDVTQTGNVTQTGDYQLDGSHNVTGNSSAGSFSSAGNVEAGSFSAGGTAGYSGTFKDKADKTVTVKNGIIVSVI